MRAPSRVVGRPFVRLVSVLAALLVAATGATRVAHADGQFTTMASGFTQKLWVVGDPNPDYLVGIAFDPSGGLWTTTSLPDHSLRHWSATAGPAVNGTSTIHPLTATVPVPGVSRILGLTNHPNGSIYGITQEGVVELNATTGALISGPVLPPGVPAGKIAITVDPTLSSGTHELVFTVRRLAGGDDSRTAIYSYNPTTAAFALLYTAPDAHDVDGIAFDPSGTYFFYAVPFSSPSVVVVLKRTGSAFTFVQTISTGNSAPDGLAFNTCSGFLMSNDGRGTLTRYDFPNGFLNAPTLTTMASGGFRGDLLGVSPFDGNAYVSQWVGLGASFGTRYDNGTLATNPSIVQIGPCFTAPAFSLAESHVNVDCFGGSNGSIDLSVSGGTAPYTYAWTPGGFTSQDLTGLTAGTYTVTMTDANNVIAKLTVVITQPSQLQTSVVTTAASCFGSLTGAIDLTVTGGTAPFTYVWSPAGPPTQDRTSLLAGTYSVTVQDANGCTTMATATVSQPALLAATGVVAPVSCTGGATGAIDLTVTGGTAPYGYHWTPNIASTQDLSGLAAGTYSVVVLDAHGCAATASFVVGQPALLQASISVTDVACFGAQSGALTLTVVGGVAPYTYEWSPSASTTQNLTGLAPGTYTVTVTDAGGCTTTGSATVSQPPALLAAADVTHVQCFDQATGAVDLVVSGGTAPYMYLWSPSGATTQDLTSVHAGSYSVTVTDAGGCTATLPVTVNQPPPLIASVLVGPVTAVGGHDGSIDLTVSGGVAPYYFVWLPGGQSSEDLLGLASGTHVVTITDSNGCTTTATADIGEALLRLAGTDLFQDAFPFTDEEEFVGYTPFDTTSALIKTGRNTAQLTGGSTRMDIPGDTLVACSCGNDLRVDLVFRIKPGPGNYHIVGQVLSGLRLVPTNKDDLVAAGDASFWGQYMANPGSMSSGTHNGGTSWDPLTWNSARMDTAETNLFPVESLGNLPGLNACAWASMYHELDPKYATLGISKHRCFVVAPGGPVNSDNITCNSVPGWVNGTAGYNGNPMTSEYTKILPDGLFTPGTHIQYFVRRSSANDPFNAFIMVPDTNRVWPQPGQIMGSGDVCSSQPGPASTDGHRWEHFGVLPDRWKHASYGGRGDACMLYIDLADGSGDERTWVSAADLMGATLAPSFGAHNGWHTASLTESPNDPANFVRNKNAQAGTSWDLYQVRGGLNELNGYAGSIGSRLGAAAALGSPASGKEARIGPTALMLRTYYRVMFMTTGRLDSGVLGPFDDRSQDDLAMLMGFRAGSLGGNSRALWVMGGSFAQAEDAATNAGYPQHNATMGTLLGGNLGNVSYPNSNATACPDIVTTAASHPASPGLRYGVNNSMLPANDILALAPGESSAIEANYFQSPPGAQSLASTMIQPYGTTYWTGLLDSWDIQDLGAQSCALGGTSYLSGVLSNVLGAMCALPTAAVEPPVVASTQTSFALGRNPVRGGSAAMRYVLGHDDVVELSVLDIAGRRVRAIERGLRKSGAHDVSWDGRDELGNLVRPGLYLVRLKLAHDSHALARTLVWLR